MVLKREPENLVALKGLAEAHIQMKNPQGAIAPLQKLVKFHPSQQDYKTLLAQVKQQVEKGDR